MIGKLGWIVTFLTMLGNAPSAMRGQENPSGGARHALLIGCTEYPELAKVYSAATYRERVRLEGSVHDVDLIHATLSRYLGFDEANIKVLSGWPDGSRASERPTRANILRELDSMGRTAKKGDLFFFFYAGHGSQQEDAQGDEADGLDEVLLPADIGPPRAGRYPRAITDDELNTRFRKIRDRGARIWVVFDCCHSGTALRAIGDHSKVRQLDIEGLGGKLRARALPGGRSARTSSVIDASRGDLSGIVAMYAVDSDQKEQEKPLPIDAPRKRRRSHGVFTYTLCHTIGELARDGRDVSFRTLEAMIRQSYQMAPWSDLSPFFEGDAASLDRTVFAGKITTRSLHLAAAEGRLELDAGSLADIEPDTILSIHPPGAAKSRPLGHVRVHRVELTSARCRPVAFGGMKAPKDLAGTYLARIVRRPVIARPLTVTAFDDRGERLEAPPKFLARAIEDSRGRFRYSKPSEPAAVFMRGRGNHIELIQDGAAFKNRFVSNEGDLFTALKRIYRVRNLMNLARKASGGRLARDVKFEIWRFSPGASEGRRLRPGEQLAPGDRVQVTITNDTGVAVDVNLLFIDANYGIQKMWPRGGRASRLSPDATRRINLFGRPLQVTDDPLGTEFFLVVAVPVEGGSGRASLDLGFLEQENLQRIATRGGPEKGIARVLSDLAFGSPGTRGLVFATGGDGPSVQLTSWTTAWPRVKDRPSDTRGVVPVRLEPARGTRPVGAKSRGIGGAPDWRPTGDVAILETTVPGRLKDVLWVGKRAVDGGISSEAPRFLLLDIDRDSTETGDAERAARGGFDAELIFRFDPDGRRTLFYDRDGDGKMDFVAIDQDLDPEADIVGSKKNNTWDYVTDAEEPWLMLSRLGLGRDESKIVTARLRRLMVR